MTPDDLKSLIRTVPDFPKPGIQFRDITTLIGHGEGLAAAVDHLAQRASAMRRRRPLPGWRRAALYLARLSPFSWKFRSFLSASRASCLSKQSASNMRWSMVRTGSKSIRCPSDTGQQVVIVDDLIATGGTAEAAVKLLREAGATVEDALFVIDLPDLGGAKRLNAAGVTVTALMNFAGD